MRPLVWPQERMLITTSPSSKPLKSPITKVIGRIKLYLAKLSEDDSKMEYILGFVHLNGWEDTAKSWLEMNLSIRQREIFITHLLYVMISTYYTNHCNRFTAPLSLEVNDGDFRELYSLFSFSEEEFRNAVWKAEKALAKEWLFSRGKWDMLPKIQYL